MSSVDFVGDNYRLLDFVRQSAAGVPYAEAVVARDIIRGRNFEKRDEERLLRVSGKGRILDVKG